MKTHLKVVHEKVSNYKCLLGCDKEFKSQYRLFVHHLSHKGIKPFKSNISSKEFFEKETLKTPKKAHLNKNLFNCAFCEFKCKKINGLVAHLRKAHSLKK